MSDYRPSSENLLATVRIFLESLAPKLAGEERYQTQVAAHLVGICERELAVGDRDKMADAAVWTALLGPDGAAEPGGARTLCAAIRDGRFDARFDDVVDAVLERVKADVRVVRPSHFSRAGAPASGLPSARPGGATSGIDSSK